MDLMKVAIKQDTFVDSNSTKIQHLGDQKGFEFDGAMQKSIRLDRLQTILKRLVFTIVYWGVLQIAFIIVYGILCIMNMVLKWQKTVMSGQNLSRNWRR